MQLLSITCKSCGAPSQVTNGTRIITCAYCGTQMVLETNAPLFDDSQNIEGLTFTTSKVDFQKALVNWLCEGDLTPDDILESAASIDFNGTFVPFWFIESEYSAEANCKVGREVVEKTFEVVKNEQGQVVDHKEKRNVRVEWVNTDRSHHGHYEILLLASSKINSSFTPFLTAQTNNVVAFNSLSEDNLSGHTLGIHDVSAEKVFDATGKNRIEKLIEQRIENKNSEKHFKIKYVSFRSINKTDKKVFLPFWIATFEYGKEQFPVIFNGRDLTQSFGNRPIDRKREQRFKEIDAPFTKACWITGILAFIGILLGVVPGIIIGIIGGIYCLKLKQKANAQKKIILDRSYRLRKEAKARMMT